MSVHFAALPVTYRLLQGEIFVLFSDRRVFKFVSTMGLQSAFAAPSDSFCSHQGNI